MKKEKLSGLQLTIIGTHEFGLTEADVRMALEDVNRKINEWEVHCNDDKRTQDDAKRILPRLIQQKDILSADPANVLARVKSFYDRTLELESSGFKRYDLSEKLYEEFPDLSGYQTLLRRETWGANLADSVIAAGAGRRMKADHIE